MQTYINIQRNIKVIETINDHITMDTYWTS
jgi:hypothetical protein